jgi:hypothetical protein
MPSSRVRLLNKPSATAASCLRSFESARLALPQNDRLVPRGLFDGAVARYQGEKHAKGMTRWSQLVALLFCQLGGARSLREITGGLAASEGKLRHLGV